MANYQLNKTGAQIDAALSLAVAHETTKADVDGNYPDLTAGKSLKSENAAQLESSVFVEDKVPYNFRTSGGSADIGNRLNDKIVGGSIAWNQKLDPTIFQNGESNGITVTSNNETGEITVAGTATAEAIISFTKSSSPISFVANHVMYLAQPAGASLATYYVRTNQGDGFYLKNIFKTSSDYTVWLRILVSNGQTVSFTFKPQLIDLTAMFGLTIADHIDSLEQANAGAGVAWFKKLFPKPNYEYNAGELISVNVSAHNTVGFNAYNPTTATAKVIGGMEYQITGTYTSISLDGTAITPNANGKFTPTNNGTITVVGGNSSDTCIHLVWDGERDGEYEEYVKHEYPLDSSLTLYGIPKLDANNELYYDGDTYESDGTVTRNYEYRAYQSGDESLTDAITDGTNTIVILATPTTESANEFQNPQIVDDFGTEEYVDYAESQGTRDVAIPVGHETQYQNNLRAKLEMSPNSPDGNGDYIVRHTNGINEYVPLVIPAELPTMPTTDGTYHLKVTVASGTATLSWESES